MARFPPGFGSEWVPGRCSWGKVFAGRGTSKAYSTYHTNNYKEKEEVGMTPTSSHYLLPCEVRRAVRPRLGRVCAETETDRTPEGSRTSPAHSAH